MLCVCVTVLSSLMYKLINLFSLKVKGRRIFYDMFSFGVTRQTNRVIISPYEDYWMYVILFIYFFHWQSIRLMVDPICDRVADQFFSNPASVICFFLISSLVELGMFHSFYQIGYCTLDLHRLRKACIFNEKQW